MVATLDRYFKPVTLTDATTCTSHSRPGAGAAASGPKRLTANKRRIARPGKDPRPSVQGRFVPIRKRHLN